MILLRAIKRDFSYLLTFIIRVDIVFMSDTCSTIRNSTPGFKTKQKISIGSNLIINFFALNLNHPCKSDFFVSNHAK